MTSRALLIALLLCACCLGCRDAEKQRHVADLTARLELARQKSDLDQMFLSLRELQSIKAATTNQIAEYVRVEKAIPILQKIQLAKADHNHEEVANQAADFLEIFPDHPEARRALKESGLIFTYLENSLRLIESSFERTADGKIHFVSTSTSEKSNATNSEPDVSTVLYNLSLADKSVTKALQLDPQFEPALRLRENIKDCRNTLGLVVCCLLETQTDWSSDKIVALYNRKVQLHNELTTFQRRSDQLLADPFRGSGDSKRRVEALQAEMNARADELEKDTSQSKLQNECKGAVRASDRLSGILADLKDTDLTELYSSARELNLKLRRFAEVVDGFDGTEDTEKKVLEKQSEFNESISKYKQSIPNKNTLTKSIEGFVSLTEKIALFKSPEKTKQVLEKHKALITT